MKKSLSCDDNAGAEAEATEGKKHACKNWQNCKLNDCFGRWGRAGGGRGGGGNHQAAKRTGMPLRAKGLKSKR